MKCISILKKILIKVVSTLQLKSVKTVAEYLKYNNPNKLFCLTRYLVTHN